MVSIFLLQVFIEVTHTKKFPLQEFCDFFPCSNYEDKSLLIQCACVSVRTGTCAEVRLWMSENNLQWFLHCIVRDLELELRPAGVAPVASIC